ncbi:hypothetical protein CONCODRAFT_10541 [Conidiobolus coronatus NRRL 28638]|uniref:Uncharacterized protein n=1 Tax=Conidiobolus coronatus (strain ATCC 28846 / CBS 209.66 / NRRL 28638) TaxID=796925 RepID=A0A137NXF1_CONC2|nr:hypothetical protein CONCODRAFT_10541 [Conidiobolus coronatus NRRL 28638]|eukprot:KXN67392.1 hypothetical protein CONCODRAFT_10541 [Conidiobolus coronatus NRRL 28638]
MKFIALLATSVRSKPIQTPHNNEEAAPSYYSLINKIGRFVNNDSIPRYYASYDSSDSYNINDDRGEKFAPSYYSLFNRIGRFVNTGATPIHYSSSHDYPNNHKKEESSYDEFPNIEDKLAKFDEYESWYTSTNIYENKLNYKLL